MTSQKQIEANLANAQLSTGPRTNRGKARSKMNAVKHALTAAQGVLIEGEDPEEFEAHCADIVAQYGPGTAFRRSLLIQLAVATWRIRRLDGLEGEFTRACQDIAADEMQKSFDDAYYNPLRDEASRRCTESFGTSPDSLLRAYVFGTYDTRFEEFFEEVCAEALERGDKPPNKTLTEDELAEAHQTGALMIFVEEARNAMHGKFDRYRTSLHNNISRIFKHLEAEEKLTRVIDA